MPHPIQTMHDTDDAGDEPMNNDLEERVDGLEERLDDLETRVETQGQLLIGEDKLREELETLRSTIDQLGHIDTGGDSHE